MQQIPQTQNPFVGLEEILKLLENSPEQAMQHFLRLAQIGIRPPEFRDRDSLINSVTQMRDGFRNSSQRNAAVAGATNPMATSGSAPMMPNPQELGNMLAGGNQNARY